MNKAIMMGVLSIIAVAASIAPVWASPDAFTPVPEPASLLLFGTGAGAVILARRMRRRNKRD